MKTIYQWLLQLPSGYREAALRNTKQSVAQENAPSLFSAIARAFTWSGTPEGSKFWNELRRCIDIGMPLPPLPASAEETKPNQTNNMPNYSNTPVVRPTLVYGEDVADMSESRCLQLIKQNQEAAKALESLGVASRTIDARIAEYTAVNAELVKRLDSFTPPAPAISE